MEYKVTKTLQGFYYVDLGDRGHEVPELRLWVSPKLVQNKVEKVRRGWLKEEGADNSDEARDSIVEKTTQILSFNNGLLKNSKIVRTEKGNWKLSYDESSFTRLLSLESGYRGEAKIETLGLTDNTYIRYNSLHSPTGSLGNTCYLMLSLPNNGMAHVYGHKDGRRVPNSEMNPVWCVTQHSCDMIETDLDLMVKGYAGYLFIRRIFMFNLSIDK